MKIKEIALHLEQIAPLALQESYDNSGLIVGHEETDVTGVLICLDSTEDVVLEAILKGCNLIIAHHPVIFKGIKKLNGKNYIERTIIKAIQNNIAIYAIHTNLDNVVNGVNAKIAQKIGLKNAQILSPKKELLRKLITYCPTENAEEIRKALFDAGAGSIGKYDECSFNTLGSGTFKASENANPYVGKIGERHIENEIKIETVFPFFLESAILKALLQVHPYEEVAYDVYSLQNSTTTIGSGMIGDIEEELEEMDFLKFLKSSLDLGCIRYTAATRKKIKRVAVCGGSGSFLLKEAISQGAQAFVTADFKYHEFFDAEKKILVADIGHYESEQYTKELICELLNKKNYTFAIHLSEINTNPINYI